ncbi:MAG: alpha-L-rhamnosidase N-terminal domain-containing protein [Phocaeicola sp.]|uniref:glycoside hydrolase family 78 protein n=1 Tax=Phocaeicola sp. TaxID=2773926 RepID=UPI003FA122A9
MKFINKRIFLFFAFCLTVYFAFAVDVKINRLTCENVNQPLCIGTVYPLLAWQCTSSIQNDHQTAYQIIVSDNQEDINRNKGNLWNSGIVKSEDQNNVIYKGKKLRSDTRYYWKVRVWNTNEEISEWSDVAYFETGLLYAKDWKGQWIGDGTDVPSDEKEAYKDAPAPIFRKTYQVDKKVVSAKLYITGLGYYEATINGKKVTETVLNPGWTDYRHSIL